MPYNVIILTSTVIALAFGSIFNLLVRRFVAAEEAASVGLRATVLGKFVVLRDKLRGKAVKVE
jgi:phosphatidylinositol glycan class T